MTLKKRNCLVLVQHRTDSPYNDFIGKFYHFPKSYLKQFENLPIEFIYYEPAKRGEGGYFGYGRIEKTPFKDKREKDHFFAEIAIYKTFSAIVSLKDDKGEIREDKEHYNPRNAVREISPSKLDEICLDGKINLSFKTDAHLIKVLGEQLIASEKVGILELIKNAYDAQASYCRVVIEKIGSLPEIDESQYEFKEYEGPVIVIEDDGTGMTKDTIENGWLRPASPIKTNIKDRLRREREKAIESNTLGVYNSLLAQLKKEHKGRIPLGEKGVGRFATHRLGRKLIIKTKVANLNYEYVLEIDWDSFDEISEKFVDLDSIGIHLTKQPPSRDYGETNSGIQLIIYGGRGGFDWDESKVRELNDSIMRLNTPNPQPEADKTIFHVYIECPQLPDLKTYDILEEFESTFTFEGLVDENGILDYKLEFKPPPSVPMSLEITEDKAFDLKKTDKDYWKALTGKKLFRRPKCGPFFMHLDVWYRRSPWVSGPHANALFDYLTELGGISIYRDGINIFPAEWGAETDWLTLSKRHIQVGRRLSYYNMIGNIEINQMDTPDLVDKTDREGLVRNTAFMDLIKLVRSIIMQVEMEFIDKRNKYHELTSDVTMNPRVLNNYIKQTDMLVSNILKNYPISDDPYSILAELGERDQREVVIDELQKSIVNLEESLYLINEAQNLLTEQAGYGLSIAVTLHEITKNISNLYLQLMRMLKSRDFDIMRMDDLMTNAQFLNLELRRLRPLRATRIENWVEFSILKSAKFIGEIFRNNLNKSGIKLNIGDEKDFKIFGRPAAVNQIFTNLIDNSWYWLGTIGDGEKVILITIDPNNRTVIIADSGPGIDQSMLKYLFQPGYSLRSQASGLGLYICRYYMQSMRGDIYVTPAKQRVSSLPGAQFTLDFSKVVSEKEEYKK